MQTTIIKIDIEISAEFNKDNREKLSKILHTFHSNLYEICRIKSFVNNPSLLLSNTTIKFIGLDNESVHLKWINNIND